MERRPRCYGFYVKRLRIQIIHTKSKAATDFHPKGRRDSRRIEQVRNQRPVITFATMAPLIFISCGQSTDQEKKLGKAVVAIVRGFGFEPYFAETQSSLNGLHENILNKLNDCAGLISIMHDRGRVSGLGGTTHTRGSVWIEQEIAIAAFITHTLKRKIEVASIVSYCKSNRLN
jgi:hypothetical protein